MSQKRTKFTVRLTGAQVRFDYPQQALTTQEQRIDRFYSRSNNLKKPFEAFGAHMKDSIKRTFDAQGRPQKWQRLSPAYAAWKRKMYPGNKILVLTGALLKGFNPKATRSKFWIENLVATRSGYNLFELHQQGTIHMPARPPLVLQPEDRQMFQALMRDWLFE